MRRNFTAVYAVCVLLFFLILAAVLLLQLNDARNAAIARSQAHFAGLHDALAAQAADDTIEPLRIRQTLSDATTVDGDLRAVAVYSFDSGLEYLWVRNRTYLAAGEPTDLASPFTPQFKYYRLNEVVLTDSLRSAAGQTLVVEAVYRTLEGAVWYRLLHNALTALLVFALTTVLVGIGVLITNRSPRPALQPAVETLEPASSLFSPHSGVSYESHLERRLDLELERAATNDQDLGLALGRFPGIAPGTESYQRCARSIVEQFLFEDLIFEQGSDGFAIVLPNTDLDRTIKQFELFYRRLQSVVLPGKPMFGLTARSGRLIEAERLIREAQQALGKAQREVRPIIAFKADPRKYRDYVAGHP